MADTIKKAIDKDYLYNQLQLFYSDILKVKLASADALTSAVGRIEKNETKIGDITAISYDDLVSAITDLLGKDAKSITYSGRVVTVTMKNDETLTVDLSTMINGIVLSDLSNVDDTAPENGQVLAFDSADSKFKPATVDLEGTLALAKKYTDEEIVKTSRASSISVDEKPTIDEDGIVHYLINGEEHTMEESNVWFYYKVDDTSAQTKFINGVEYTIDLSSINFEDYIDRNIDITSMYTGTDVDKTKIPNIVALDSLYKLVTDALALKIATTDIVDNLETEDATKPLSANQGVVLNVAISSIVESLKDYVLVEDVYTKTEIDDALLLKADKKDTYTVEDVDKLLDEKANAEDVYTKEETDKAIEDAISEIGGDGTLALLKQINDLEGESIICINAIFEVLKATNEANLILSSDKGSTVLATVYNYNGFTGYGVVSKRIQGNSIINLAYVNGNLYIKTNGSFIDIYAMSDITKDLLELDIEVVDEIPEGATTVVIENFAIISGEASDSKTYSSTVIEEKLELKADADELPEDEDENVVWDEIFDVPSTLTDLSIMPETEPVPWELIFED